MLDHKLPDADVEAMRNCLQDPVHHAEGDVWTHTQMVLAALNTTDRALNLTGLYHDIAKPITRTVEFDDTLGRSVVRHPNHSRLGAARAWYRLWSQGEPLVTALEVYWLCRWHQRVFHLWSYDDMLRLGHMFAAVGSWPRLIQFARADNAGRICPNPQEAADNLDLLELWLDEHITSHQWQTPFDRQFYLEKPNRSPHYAAQEPTGSRVIILCGLPGVGKDTHCRTVLSGLPTVSMDDIREAFGVDPTDNQGQIRQAALEQARTYLRARRPFVWNAQTTTRLMRDKIVGLCRAYDAHVTIHAFYRPLERVLRQNRQRDRQVPEKIILAAAEKWEPPSLLEAHAVHWITD